MSAAAFALGLAVLVSPGSSKSRAKALNARPLRRLRLPVVPCAICVGAAMSMLAPISVVVALGLLAATLLRRGRLLRRRTERGEEARALQDALDALVAELRVGVHPVAAVEAAAAEARGSVSASLSAVAARAKLGADVAAGLRVQGQRSAAPECWERLAVCWQLAHDHGVGIATLMQAAAHDIAERERFRSHVDAGMAGARATAAILAGLPVLGLLLGHAIGADPVGFLLSGGAGGWLLVAGTSLICCGLLWSDSITTRVTR